MNAPVSSNRKTALQIALIAGLVASSGAIGYMMGGSRPGEASHPPASGAGSPAVPRPGPSALAAGKELPAGAPQESSLFHREPWTRQRLMEAGRGAVRESNIVSMVRRSMRIADQLEAGDFPLAMDVARELKETGGDADVIGAILLARWAELNPAAAADFLGQGERSQFIDIESDLVWSAWASTDPVAALAGARKITHESTRESALKKIVESLARRDPASAMAFAKANVPELLENGQLKDAIDSGALPGLGEETARKLAAVGDSAKLEDATEKWALKDRAAAMDWARSLTEPKARVEALKGAYGAWFAANPQEALAALRREDPSQPGFQTLANFALFRWPASDRENALAWAAQLPAGLNLTDGIGYLAEEDARKSPETAAKWLEKLPAGRARDEAVARFGVQAIEKDGDAAMAWAHTISDPGKRVQTMHRLARDWFSRDPAAAYEWLQNNTLLTPEERAEILKK